MAYTAADLLTSIRRRAGIPAASGVFSESELLTLATEELRSYVVPFVLREREDYWLYTHDQTITTETSWRIPPRAIGGKLRDVALVLDSGAERYLPRLSPADLEDSDVGFYLDGKGVRLFTRPGVSLTSLGQKLRMRYFLRPSTLIGASGSNTTVLSVNPGAYQITLTSITGLSSAFAVDIVSQYAPWFSVYADATPTVPIAGTTLTFTATTYPTGVAAGDLVFLPDTSQYPQIPVELHDLLAQRCAVKVLASKQMTEKMGSAMAELKELEAMALVTIQPRVDSKQPVVINRNSLHRMRF